MKISRLSICALSVLSTAICGCGALTDAGTASSQDQTPPPQAASSPAPSTPTLVQQAPPSPAGTSLSAVPTTTFIDGKTVPLKSTPEGVEYYDGKIGTGPSPVTGDTVGAQYTGMTLDGKVFDSTTNRGGTPFTFTIGEGQVIKGWDIGMMSMKVGGQRRLVIPGALAYGANPPTAAIPANGTLVFDVTLVSVTPAAK